MEGGRRLEERLKGKEGADESDGESGITKGWRGKEEGMRKWKGERAEIEGKGGKRRKKERNLANRRCT